jgi:hypothetical protein
MEGRDAVWTHPDLLPDAEDLADPERFLTRAELDPSVFEDKPDQGDSRS